MGFFCGGHGVLSDLHRVWEALISESSTLVDTHLVAVTQWKDLLSQKEMKWILPSSQSMGKVFL